MSIEKTRYLRSLDKMDRVVHYLALAGDLIMVILLYGSGWEKGLRVKTESFFLCDGKSWMKDLMEKVEKSLDIL